MGNAEQDDMDMLSGMGASNDAISEAARRKKKKPAPTPTPAPESDQSWWQRVFGGSK